MAGRTKILSTLMGSIALVMSGMPVLLIAVWPTEAQAQSQIQIDIPAGRLSTSIRKLARQANVSIVSKDNGIRNLRARAVRGTMSTRTALDRLLAGTPFRAVSVRGGYRIERHARPSRSAQSGRSASPESTTRPTPTPVYQSTTVARAPIIVEASKRPNTLFDYPGGAKVAYIGGLDQQNVGEGLDQTLADIPSVNGTALGSGRNKIFLRGVADSSFNGPTQATIGLYLGEQRLLFSAPNPDLRLYDVETVEILEGPQGTLHGAGAIAGLLRINPNRPDASGTKATAWGSIGSTQDGGDNWSVGAMGNVPLSDAAALRFVGYGGEESGYINDPSRRLTDINWSEHYGGRAALSIDLGPDWNAELSGFGQRSELRDGQYIDARLNGLSRTDLIAQPFRGRIYGANYTIRGYVGDVEIVSATGLVDHNLSTTFDSSFLTTDGNSRPGKQAFQESREIRLISHETRISGGDPERVSWLAGVSALRNRDEMRQIITNLNGDSPPPFAELIYRLDEIATFGEASYQFVPRWTLTSGARVLYTSATGERSFGPNTVVEPREGPVRVLPAFALAWKPDDSMMAYVRHERGFRTGGVTIERDGNRDPQTARFDPDRVRSFEVGVRGTFGQRVPLDFALTAFHSDWNDIQADLINAEGFPITRNIGDGKITGLDASMSFETAAGWSMSLSGTWNDSSVDRLRQDGSIRSVPIPNVPDYSAMGRLSKSWQLTNNEDFGLQLTGRYMGRSFLDLDQQVRSSQGDFGTLDFATWWSNDWLELRAEASNLTNTRGNRFAFGNPFTARTESQATPLRPRTIQLQLTIKR